VSNIGRKTGPDNGGSGDRHFRRAREEVRLI
jgi:hypothetical protein